jgi:hypothetical protein
MNHARVGAWAAVGLLVTLAIGSTGCSSAELPVRTTVGVTNMQGSPPVEQDRGWASLVEADREIGSLQALRDQTPDIFVQDALNHQIDTIRKWSDALTDAMTIGDGQVHDVQIDRLSANLERAMSAGVAAEMQGDNQTEQHPTGLVR